MVHNHWIKLFLQFARFHFFPNCPVCSCLCISGYKMASHIIKGSVHVQSSLARTASRCRQLHPSYQPSSCSIIGSCISFVLSRKTQRQWRKLWLPASIRVAKTKAWWKRPSFAPIAMNLTLNHGCRTRFCPILSGSATGRNYPLYARDVRLSARPCR